jgi:UDP-N-acetylglucosamine--N-acetylmuramyl-(pentapeptide) pyrophosphoryl-undecaprenol N-acetylglucosamine transferase
VISTARALAELVPEATFQFFASPRGIEGQLLEDNGYQPVRVEAERLQRDSLLRLPGAVIRGTWKARRALKEFRPQVIVSGGGFVSPPVVLAARWLGIPVLMLEPNSVGGRANRLFSRLAQVIVTGHPSAAESFPDPSRVECLGMPMAFRRDPEQAKTIRSRHQEALVVGVLGGSLGARILNQAVWENYPALSSLPGLRLIHVSGQREYEQARKAWKSAGEPEGIELRAFQKAMDEFYQEVDLLVSRAGAMTCYELVEFELPALLVPRALSHGDHQTKNARPLQEAGAAEIVSEREFSGEGLLETLRGYLADPESLVRRRQAYQGIRHPRADQRVARRVLELAGYSGKEAS